MQTITQLMNSGRKIIWLDYSDYADVLLAHGAMPWLDVATYIALKRTAQALLRSDVMQLPVSSICGAWVDAHPELRSEMASKNRTGFALKTLLADPALRVHLQALVGGLRDSFKELPLALVCPSPHVWINKATEIAHNKASNVELNEDDIDSGSVYVADFLRIFGESDINILLIDESKDYQPDLELYQPVLNVASHYRWEVGLHVSQDMTAHHVTFLIAPNAKLGRELTKDFWESEHLPDCPVSGFFYTCIPSDAEPEFVLSRLSQLRA